MSLLSSQMETFCYISKTRTEDGEGGYNIAWTDGEEFTANARLDSSSQATTAEVHSDNQTYTITTRKAVTLKYHDVIKRLSDSKIFRVTSDGYDDRTPPTAGLNMRQVRAEEYTTEGE